MNKYQQQQRFESQNSPYYALEDPSTVKCDHSFVGRCGSDIKINKCMVEVSRTYPCKHIIKSHCFQQADICPEACTKRLDCGHKCSGTCGECSSRRIHSTCSQGCGQQCVTTQCNICSLCQNRCENRCVHTKCPNLCGELCVPCFEPCEWYCEHYKCTKYCYEACNRPRCNRPCSQYLPCGHPCVGLCGERCPRLCRLCDYEELREIFFGTEHAEDARFVELEDCGHTFEVSGLDQLMSEEIDGKIQLIVCPKCNVPIRYNLRYGQIIKTILMNIYLLQDRFIRERREIDNLIFLIKMDIYKLPVEYLDDFQDEWRQSIMTDQLTLGYWSSFRYRLQFILSISKYMKNKIFDFFLDRDTFLDLLRWILHHKGIFSKSQLEEIKTEIERLGKILEFHEAKGKHMVNYTVRLKIERGLQMLENKDYRIVRDKILKILKEISVAIPVDNADWSNQDHWHSLPN